MQVTAYLKSLRIAPRKVRLLANLMKGRDAIAAKHQLAYLAKRSALPLTKLLDSALANAENNFGLVKSNMRVKDVVVDGGPVLKRFKPKGFGSTSPLAKRTSHVTVILEEKIPGLKSEKKAKTEKIEKEVKSEAVKPEVKKELGPKDGPVKSFTRKLFQRKSI
ncbi:MAG: 50S ribosomal protein L22 [Patescibacteria group bacterium]